MDGVEAQKAFRKPSALIEINLGFEWLAGVRRFEYKGLWIGCRFLDAVVIVLSGELAWKIISLHCHGHEFVFRSSSIRRKTFIATSRNCRARSLAFVLG